MAERFVEATFASSLLGAGSLLSQLIIDFSSGNSAARVCLSAESKLRAAVTISAMARGVPAGNPRPGVLSGVTRDGGGSCSGKELSNPRTPDTSNEAAAAPPVPKRYNKSTAHIRRASMAQKPCDRIG